MCFDADSRPPISPNPDGPAESGEVILTAGDGTRLRAFRERAPAPIGVGVLVLPDQRGLHRYYEELAERFGELGMDALAIDWYARTAGTAPHGPDFDEHPHIPGLSFAGLLADITAGFTYLRSAEGGAVPRLVPVGFCLGGRLAFLCATRTDADASVAYYGVGLEGLLGEKHAIARPLMLHIAGADHFVTPDKQKLIHDGLDDHPKVVIHDYPGEDHGFAAEMGKRRSEQAARLADSRTEAFFDEHLG